MGDADDDWTLYADHRRHLTEAILAAAPHESGAGGARLCVLGAGRCNDVDLERLALVFSEIHLVDIDPAALGAAVARQRAAVRARLRPHARVDLSGVSRRLGKWERRPPTVTQIEAGANATLQSLLAELPGPFEVVVSACVLTQMAFAVRDELGDAHPMLALIRLSVIATHLNTLVGLTARRGIALLVSDLASTTTFPASEMSGPNPLAVVNRILASGSAYHSANPGVIRSILAGDALRPHVGDPEMLAPWIWTGRLGRTYFVYALRIPRA